MFGAVATSVWFDLRVAVISVVVVFGRVFGFWFLVCGCEHKFPGWFCLLLWVSCGGLFVSGCCRMRSGCLDWCFGGFWFWFGLVCYVG